MLHPFHLAAAIAVGACLSFQPPINAAMARALGSPLLAATVSIAISLVTVLLLFAVAGRGAGDSAQLRALPAWVLLGGVIGVVFVAGSIHLAPTLGVAAFFVCVVAGQLLGATLADRIGAFGAQVQPISGTKLVGLGLVLAGAALVQRGA